MSSMREAGHPEPVLWDHPEGGGGEGGGRGRRTGDACTPVADSGCCTVDTVTLLDFNPPIKVNKFIFHKKAIW